MKPAIIDSQGKPGIAGSTTGVELKAVEEVVAYEGVLATVSVDTDVLTSVLVDGVAVVIT